MRSLGAGTSERVGLLLVPPAVPLLVLIWNAEELLHEKDAKRAMTIEGASEEEYFIVPTRLLLATTVNELQCL